MTRVTLLLVTALVATATAGRLGANGHGMLDGAMAGAMAKKAEWLTQKAKMALPPMEEEGQEKWAELKALLGTPGALKQKLGELKGKAASLAAEKKAAWGKKGGEKDAEGKWLKQKLGELKGKAASAAAEKKAAWGKKGGEKDAEGKWSFLFKGMFAKLKEGKGKKDWGKKDWGKKDWGKKDWGKKGKKGSRRPQWSEAMLQAFTAKAAALKARGEKVQWRDEKARFVRSYCAAHAADAFCARAHPARPARGPSDVVLPPVSVAASEMTVGEYEDEVEASVPVAARLPESEAQGPPRTHGAVHPVAVVGIVGAVGLVGAAALVAVRRRRAANVVASAPPVATATNQVSLMPISNEVSTQEYSML